MAKEKLELIKKIVLFSFVTISLGLIILIWKDGLTESKISNSSSSRQALRTASVGTVTATPISGNAVGETEVPMQQKTNPVASPTITPTPAPVFTLTPQPTIPVGEDAVDK